MQIETPEAVNAIDDIAAVDGVDVLFIGPLDLSVNLGIPQQFDHSQVSGCQGKGLRTPPGGRARPPESFCWTADHLDAAVRDGFTFIALGSDGGLVAAGMQNVSAAFDPHTA